MKPSLGVDYDFAELLKSIGRNPAQTEQDEVKTKSVVTRREPDEKVQGQRMNVAKEIFNQISTNPPVALLPEDIFEGQKLRFEDIQKLTGADADQIALRDAISKLQQEPVGKNYAPAMAMLDSLLGTNVAKSMPVPQTSEERLEALAKLNALASGQSLNQLGNFTQFSRAQQIEPNLGGLLSGLLPTPGTVERRYESGTSPEKPIDTSTISNRMRGLQNQRDAFDRLISKVGSYVKAGKDVPGVGPLDSTIADSKILSGALASAAGALGMKGKQEHIKKGQLLKGEIVEAAKNAIQAMGDTRPSDKDFMQAERALSAGDFDESNLLQRLRDFRRGIDRMMIDTEAGFDRRTVEEFRRRQSEAEQRRQPEEMIRTFQGKKYKLKPGANPKLKESWEVVE